MKCPFCDSKHTARNGYDDDSMDIWKCMACGETFTQADLDNAAENDSVAGEAIRSVEDDPDFEGYPGHQYW